MLNTHKCIAYTQMETTDYEYISSTDKLVQARQTNLPEEIKESSTG